ncbi:holin [Glutamicibacter arilaitensis]|uniref:holin n=1 Tax=Glutamicibacter arilaitensis TaxID=256701 RepID=UPI003F91F025
MFTIEFWKGAGERAVKTFLQTFVAVVVAGVGADVVGVSAGLLDVSWLDALSVSALATIMSLATSAGNADFTAGTTKVVQLNLDTDAVVEKVKADYEAKHAAE